MKSKYDGYSFPLRDSVQREKVRFHNRYGIELAGDLYLPREAAGRLAAIAVAGPFGAVKEQCAGLYAEELASRGFSRVAVLFGFLVPPTSTQRTFPPRWTSSPPRTLPIRKG